MFTIEFVVFQGRNVPAVVEKMASAVQRIGEAEAIAKSLFDKVKRKSHATPPDGFQIRGASGSIVLRSWRLGPH